MVSVGSSGPASRMAAGAMTRTGPTAAVSRFALRHVPALDGARGVAVAAVVLFHTGRLTGGYLGVDLFFVLSGFLITTLLLEERIDTGGVDLPRFWRRRARRLLPALGGLLAGLALWGWLAADANDLAGLGADVVATVFYVANWHTIAVGHDYWDLAGAPPLLQHTWSLAIEEQFYLVWPLLLGGLLAVGSGRSVLDRLGLRRRRLPGRLGFLSAVETRVPRPVSRPPWLLPTVTALCIAFAVGLAVRAMAIYDPGDPSRAYLGTDTRIPALLAGAGLASWLQWRGPARGRRARIALEVAGLAGMVVLAGAWLFLWGESDALFRGGLALCGAAAVAVLAAASHPHPGRVARVLSWRPLCWLGLISYGLYLWHWPVIVILNQQQTGIDGPALTVVQIGLSLLLAICSYHLLEMPIRRHGLAAWRWRPVLPALGVVIVALTLLVASSAIERPDATEVASGVDDPLPVSTDAPVGSGTRLDPAVPIPRPAARWPRLLVVGDSVAWSIGTRFTARPGAWMVNPVNRALVACPLNRDGAPTVEANGHPTAEREVCRTWPTVWKQAVDAFKPDAVLVVFGGTDVRPRQIGGHPSSVCDPEYERWYRAQLDDGLRLASSGGAVAYVATAAYGGIFGAPAELDESTDCQNRYVRDAVAANPSSRLIPLDTWVCPTRDTCRVTLPNGQRLRHDGLHYSGAGADEVCTWLVGQIFAAPGTATLPPPTTAVPTSAPPRVALTTRMPPPTTAPRNR